MSRWTILRLDGGLGPHASDWDALNASMNSANPLLDARFIDALLRNVGSGQEFLCIFHVDHQARAMCILRHAGPGVWRSFLPTLTPIGATLIRHPDAVATLFRDLPGFAWRVDLLGNDPLDGEPPGLRLRPTRSVDCSLTVEIRSVDSFEAYWRGRPTTLQSELTGTQQQIAAEGLAPRFEEIRSAPALAQALDRHKGLEPKAWTDQTGKAVQRNAAQGRLFAEVIEAFARSEDVSIHELWLGDRLAASCIVLRAESRHVVLSIAGDESLSRLLPDQVLLKQILEVLFARTPKGGSVEFHPDATQGVLAWGTDSRWVQHVGLFRNTVVAQLDALRRVLRRGTRTQRDRGGDKRAEGTVEQYAHPNQFPEDVRQLFDVASEHGMESGTVWYGNLVDTVFPHEPFVRFLVLRQHGRPVAALPVMLQQEQHGTQVRALSNFYTALYAPVLTPTAPSSALVPLVEAAKGLHPQATGMRFAPMDQDSRTFRALQSALIECGLPAFDFYCFGNWYLPVTFSWAQYLEQRTGKLRSTVRRMGRKFTAAGGTLQVHCSAVEVETALQAYQLVYAESWKVAEPFPDFMPGLIRACAAQGWMRVAVARLDGRPVASQFWIVTGAKAYIYKLAHDQKYHSFAPGTLLTATLMQHVLDQDRVVEVDYLIGDDEYKSDWMSHRRERWGLVAYDPASIGGIIDLAREIVGRVVRRVRGRSAPHPASHPHPKLPGTPADDSARAPHAPNKPTVP